MKVSEARAASGTAPSAALTKVTRIAERLSYERERGFVGRAAEVALFSRMLQETTHSLLFVSGQVGVGKSSLLHELERLALAENRLVVFIDANQLGDDLAHARAFVRERLQPLLAADEVANEQRRSVLFVDGFESLGRRFDWLLTELTSALAAGVLLVFASRSDLPQALSLDSGWRSLAVHRELMPFVDAEALKFLQLRGVPQAAREAIVDSAAGFPLALAVAAEVTIRAGQAGFSLNCLQDTLLSLARLLSPPMVSSSQQLALDVCSLARVTTAELLDHVCESLGTGLKTEGQELFNWLMLQSFIEWTPSGLRPHLVARMGLQTRLRRESPRRHRATLQALREFSVSELAAGSNPEADLMNLFFLDRDVGRLGRWAPPVDIRPMEQAQPADHRSVVDLIRDAEGCESSALAAMCLQNEADHFEVVREDVLGGVLHYRRLNAGGGPEKLLDGDPASDLVRRFMTQYPLQNDEESVLCRWFLDREDYQTPSTRVLAVTGRLTQVIVAGKQIPYSFCVFRNTAAWASLWKDIGLPWQLVGRFTLGQREYSLLAFMWRRRSLRDVLIQAWRHPDANASSNVEPSFDELRFKVSERVANLAQRVKLTPREVEILEQLCLGHSIEDVARNLSIRPRTVKFHKENLLHKTGASSRAELFKKLL